MPARRCHGLLSESRPAREGLELARRLADAGIAVELFSDAAISSAVPASDAVIVGADAVGPGFFVNKVGTGALCALAHVLGVPVYALAGREKILNEPTSAKLALVEGSTHGFPSTSRSGPGEKPLFRAGATELLSALVTDAGPKSSAGQYMSVNKS